MRLRFCMVVVLVAVASPPGAPAATVRMISVGGNGHDFEPPRARVAFAAAAGEQNIVVVTGEAPGTWLVRDEGAPLSPGPGCAPLDANTVRCTSVLLLVVTPTVQLELGDRDDRASLAAGVTASVPGESGDDVVSVSGLLHGGPGNDTLTGGSGADTLTGGAGRDVLRGGAGDDTLAGDGDSDGRPLTSIEDDVIDGGDGQDTIDYGSRATAVVVDLADALPDGARGERDRLIAIENVTAGAGDDILRGNASPNKLAGSLGRDSTDGRGGPDTLYDFDDDGADVHRGGAGDDILSANQSGDRLFGGAGNDRLASFARRVTIDAGPGDDEIALGSQPSSLRCGSGLDTLSGRLNSVRRPLALITMDGCERLSTAYVIAATRPQRATKHTLRLPIECRAAPFGYPWPDGCRGDVSLRLLRDGRTPITLGRGTYELGSGDVRSVAIPLAAHRRRTLSSERRPLVEVTLTATRPNAPWVPATFTWRWRVHLI